MRVERLSLSDFRSYRTLDVTFPAGPQVVVGPNAAGKTNLLESLIVLASARSHRTATDAELVSWGAEFARLEASVTGESHPSAGDETALEVVIASSTPAAGTSSGGRKRVRVNGVARRAAALAAALPVVLFAPEDMLLVVGSPSLRRQVLDGLVVQLTPTASAAMATYGRALTQRNNLLRAVRDGLADPDELRFWSRVVCEEGGRIVEWRRSALSALARPLAETHAEIAPADGRLELSYLTNAEPDAGEDATAALRRRLAETAEKELWNGATLVGPHRDDVGFLLGGRDMTTFASRGQQRTAILALKLAHLDLLRGAAGKAPLLLLDDVFSELDPERRGHLVRRIGELPQAFVTTTTLDDLDPALVSASTAWQVAPGLLEPALALRRSA
jgi:DNA replication and repair protein RecF